MTYGLFCNTLRKKDIKVNGKRINKDIILYNGDIVLVYIADSLLEEKKPANLDIIYEDDNILFINKLSILK